MALSECFWRRPCRNTAALWLGTPPSRESVATDRPERNKRADAPRKMPWTSRLSGSEHIEHTRSLVWWVLHILQTKANVTFEQPCRENQFVEILIACWGSEKFSNARITLIIWACPGLFTMRDRMANAGRFILNTHWYWAEEAISHQTKWVILKLDCTFFSWPDCKLCDFALPLQCQLQLKNERNTSAKTSF